ncbi:pentatricopeptide repeat-containing protein-like, chloroplastic [Iris pallida]|uniref:Pentatricopeptide repeat-containing protein-like, chloroplastic n=1 Tax=Iris pallida TaxID=29817 RepID=A0AAX6IH31_IRIPA|nr:pentatricopeptide repeat-containing protein-like, chloroplastic [Iris pallida]KAJ6851675.1 pentatricopeptide repeat-containing protein-like, chloroplastic [Iris pallida]
MMQRPPSHLLSFKKRPLNSWNAMIQTSIANGFFSESLDLYSSMLSYGTNGDNFTFPSVAKACAKLRSIRDGIKVHAHTVLLGFQSHVFVQTSLVDMYSKCSHLEDSRQVFDEMPMRTLVSWNSIISAYSHHLRTLESFGLFGEMRSLGTKPSSSTLVGLVSSCTDSGRCSSVHCYGIKVGFDSDLRFSNSVMNMYVTLGMLGDATSLFDSMERRSNVSWSILIDGYAGVGDGVKVFALFNRMRRDRVELDSVAFVGLVSQCAQFEGLSATYSVHGLLIKNGFVRDSNLAALTVTVYARHNDLVSARKVFDSVEEKDVSLWTSMIGGYVRHGRSLEALDLFQELLRTTVKPNEVTVITILSACADFGLLSMGEKVEEYVTAVGFGSDLRVCTSLIHMYCKCGCIERAKEIFDGVSSKDLAAWSAMIKGYACHGRGREALALFEEMKKEGLLIKPDAIMFTEILSACSHSGLVEEGLRCFESMERDFGVEPNVKHYSCVVDLLARAGHFDCAAKLVERLPA